MQEKADSYRSTFLDSFNASVTNVSSSPVVDKELYLNESAVGAAGHTERLRQELFQEIPVNLENIDIASIESFFELYGLPLRDFLIFNESQTQKYNQICAKYGWGGIPEPQESAKYFGVTQIGTNVSVVERDHEMEAIHGPLFSEVMLVHELVHASSSWNEWSIVHHDNGRTLSAKRMGLQLSNMENSIYTTGNKNAYFEEGFVAMVTQDYLRFKGATLEYVSFSDEAGKGIRALTEFMPALNEALRMARSSVEGLRDVAKMINSIEPGLYASLGKLPYTEEGFMYGTYMIQSAISEQIEHI